MHRAQPLSEALALCRFDSNDLHKLKSLASEANFINPLPFSLQWKIKKALPTTPFITEEIQQLISFLNAENATDLLNKLKDSLLQEDNATGNGPLVTLRAAGSHRPLLPSTVYNFAQDASCYTNGSQSQSSTHTIASSALGAAHSPALPSDYVAIEIDADTAPLLPQPQQHPAPQHLTSSDLTVPQALVRDITDATKLAILAGGCYLSFTGTKKLFELIAPKEVSYLIAGITALTNFQILRSSTIDLKEFSANKLPCILFAAGNAFTSALLTYREAPVMWQQWAFSTMNGTVNIPFGTDTVLSNISTATDFLEFWKAIPAKERMILFFNFMIVFAIVLCCLIGFAAPVIALLVEGLSTLMTNSWVIYGLTGFATALTNFVECFFQINAMICLKSTEQKTQWFGYISVPWKPSVVTDRLRFCLAIVFSFVSSLSFGGFTATTLLPFTPLSGTVILAVLSLVAPFWSNMKAADSVLAAPLAHFLRHPVETLSGILSSAGERLRPYYLGICSLGEALHSYTCLTSQHREFPKPYVEIV